MEEQQQSPADDKANETQRQERSLPDDFLEQVHRLREQVIQDSKGELFEDSTELIRQEREKRTKQLMQAATCQYDDEEESTTPEQAVPNETKVIHQRRPATRRMSEGLRQIREEIMKDRNGKLFEDSTELIRREREKRTEYLMQVISGEYGKDPYEEDTLEEQP
jgi:ribosome-binding protein aMBF1 (putative translation factor)